MRILHVVPSYLPATRYGGPVYAVHGLAAALVRRGHQVQVFTSDIDGDRRLAVEEHAPQRLDGVSVRYFGVSVPRRWCRAPGMARALQAELPRVDLLHLHSLFLWPTWVAARAAERAGVPYLLSPRGMLVRELVRRRGRLRKELWLRLFEGRTLEAAAGLHATSELEAREARAFGLRLPPIHVLPNGIDPDRGDAEDGRVPEAVAAALARRPFLLFLGRLSWKKGIEHAIDALPQLPGVTLVVAGPDDEGLEPLLRRRAARGGLGARLHFTGPVAGPGKRALLGAAEALVLPSVSENFGNVVLESAAAGCPAVVSPGVGLGPELHAAGAGMVVASAELATALAGLLSDAGRRDEMRRRGPAFAARFDWAAVAARMEDVYRGLAR